MGTMVRRSDEEADLDNALVWAEGQLESCIEVMDSCIEDNDWDGVELFRADEFPLRTIIKILREKRDKKIN